MSKKPRNSLNDNRIHNIHIMSQRAELIYDIICTKLQAPDFDEFAGELMSRIEEIKKDTMGQLITDMAMIQFSVLIRRAHEAIEAAIE